MRIRGLAMTGLALTALGLGAAVTPAPLVLFNISPSEPMGLYRRVAARPAPGRLIAFRPPEAAHAYVAEAMPGRARSTFLKAIVAGEGAQTCVVQARLVVDGRRLGPTAVRDRGGRPLPRWRGCRRLSPGEWLVYSDRIPNSFDSRYYGPVTAADVVGVYAPVWTSDRGRAR